MRSLLKYLTAAVGAVLALAFAPTAAAQALPELPQLPQLPQLFLFLAICIAAPATAAAISIRTITVGTFINRFTVLVRYSNPPIKYTIHAHIHAITHWHMTTPAAHFSPSSLLIDVMAATHGV